MSQMDDHALDDHAMAQGVLLAPQGHGTTRISSKPSANSQDGKEEGGEEGEEEEEQVLLGGRSDGGRRLGLPPHYARRPNCVSGAFPGVSWLN